jgi:hypothetical protein
MTDRETIIDDGKYFTAELGSDKGFVITFSSTTPESAEDGECSDNGFSGYDSCEPDELFDALDGLSAVDIAVRYLRDKGATEPSSSSFHVGVWYSTSFQTEDYRTGEETQSSYHPKHFTVAEEAAIFKGISAR